jgi:integrase
VTANGATFKRCYCKDPETGKELGAACPDLGKRAHDRGIWSYKIRLDVTGKDGRQLKRGGFDRETDASNALDKVRDLVKLAGDDERARRKIGDMIFEKSARGGELPAVEDVRRRLGLRRENLGSSPTFGESWAAWVAMKRKSRRASYVKAVEEHGDNWLLPVLADIPVDRVTGELCVMVFERIDLFNEEIEAAREEKRRPVLPGDVRAYPRNTGVTTQHRIYASLRGFLNWHVKKLHTIPFNPSSAVELLPETRQPVKVWAPDQVGHFLTFHADDRLYWMWRLALLRGFRRGELVGMPDDAFDADAASIAVNVALVQVGKRLVWGPPKSRAGERLVGLDAESVRDGKAHRKQRARERLAAGQAWEDSGRMFTDELGAALSPEYVSRRFREMAVEAGLPVIKFHAARHTAATLALLGGTDPKIVSETLGHASAYFTQDFYQHVSVQAQIGAAETVVKLLQKPKGKRKREA